MSISTKPWCCRTSGFASHWDWGLGAVGFEHICLYERVILKRYGQIGPGQSKARRPLWKRIRQSYKYKDAWRQSSTGVQKGPKRGLRGLEDMARRTSYGASFMGMADGLRTARARTRRARDEAWLGIKPLIGLYAQRACSCQKHLNNATACSGDAGHGNKILGSCGTDLTLSQCSGKCHAPPQAYAQCGWCA